MDAFWKLLLIIVKCVPYFHKTFDSSTPAYQALLVSSTTQDDVHSWSGYDACRAANNMLMRSFILVFSCNAQDGDCWSPESRQVDVSKQDCAQWSRFYWTWLEAGLKNTEAVKSRVKLERMLYAVRQRQHFDHVEEAAFAYENDLPQVSGQHKH